MYYRITKLYLISLIFHFFLFQTNIDRRFTHLKFKECIQTCEFAQKTVDNFININDSGR